MNISRCCSLYRSPVKLIGLLVLIGLPACNQSSSPILTDPPSTPLSPNNTSDRPRVNGDKVAADTRNDNAAKQGTVARTEMDRQRETDPPQETALKSPPPASSINEVGQKIAGEAQRPTGSQDSFHDQSASEQSGVQNVSIDRNLPEPFRLFLPTSAGPLLVDLAVYVDRRPLRDCFDESVERLLREASGGKPCTWKMLLDHLANAPERYGQRGLNRQSYVSMTRMYDRNRNQRPEREEVTKLLYRASFVDRPIQIVGNDAYRGFSRANSALFSALDRSGDGTLDELEVRRAADNLWRLDRDSDRSLSMQEVAVADATHEAMNDPWKGNASTRWGDVATDLDGYIDWKMFAYSMANYSDSALHALIDRDEDGDVSAEEMASLRMVPADLQLTIDFAESASNSSTAVSIRVEDERTLAWQAPIGSEESARIESNEVVIVVHVRDALGTAGAGGTATDARSIWRWQVRGRAAEPPDALFVWLDADLDFRLSAREIQTLPERLKAIAMTRGTDGVLRPDALPEIYLVQLARGAPAETERLFALAPSGRTSTHPSWPRWAQAMDSNGDGDISQAEFLGSSQQFESLDQDADGFLGPEECGGTLQ